MSLVDMAITKPEVIIFDMITSGIDPAGVKDFLALIKQLSRQQQLTVLLSSHHLHHVQQVCDRVGIFVEGKLLAEGNMEELSGQLFGKEGYVTSIAVEEPVSRPWPLEPVLKSWDEIEQIVIHENEIEFTSKRNITPALVRFMVEKGCNITRVNQKKYGLEDIYQKYFESGIQKADNPK